MRFDTGENEVVEVMSVQSRPVQIASDHDAERQARERQARPAPVVSEQARERQPRK